jgi:hypothetical protein
MPDDNCALLTVLALIRGNLRVWPLYMISEEKRSERLPLKWRREPSGATGG